MARKGQLVELYRICAFTIILIVIHQCRSQTYCDTDLERYNCELRSWNQLTAEYAWNISTQFENGYLIAYNEKHLLQKNMWNNAWCLRLLEDDLRDVADLRQVYLICRGPRFTSYQLSNVLAQLNELRITYDTAKIKLSDGRNYKMEPDLNTLMENSRNQTLLEEAWTKWHSFIGEELTDNFVQLVRLLNTGARQSGHRDIGSIWREEMETPNLHELALTLNHQVKHLYHLLHAYVRFKIGKFYNIHLDGKPIPAHLLGNMWAQRWDGLMDIVAPNTKNGTGREYIDEHIGRDANVWDMINYADNFYINMGFPPLPESFFENSYFEEAFADENCHGAAADMFAEEGVDDYRIMMCASVKDSDLQTMIHEMGHIHYFMAYRHLPTVFQAGANSAFQEAVGDAVAFGMYPNPNIRTLLRIGLVKLPQIAFGLVVDLWRWSIFENEDAVSHWNDYWWELNYEYLGVTKPHGYESAGLDALGKYHVADNIPYVRYFFASFLQHMFYQSMCAESDDKYCDLRGMGDKLRRMMSRGTSTHWAEILEEFTGYKTVTSAPLLKYFKPLQDFLELKVVEHNLTVGWRNY